MCAVSSAVAKVALFETQFLVAAGRGWGRDDEKHQRLYSNHPLSQQMEVALKIECDENVVGIGHWKTVQQDSTYRRGMLGCTFMLPSSLYQEMGGHPALFLAPSQSAFEAWEHGLMPQYISQKRRLDLPDLPVAPSTNWIGLPEARDGHFLAPLSVPRAFGLEQWSLVLCLLRSVLDVAQPRPSNKRCLVLGGVKEATERNAMANCLLWMLPRPVRGRATTITWVPRGQAIEKLHGRFSFVMHPWPEYDVEASHDSLVLDMSRPIPGQLDPASLWPDHRAWQDLQEWAAQRVAWFDREGPQALDAPPGGRTPPMSEVATPKQLPTEGTTNVLGVAPEMVAAVVPPAADLPVEIAERPVAVPPQRMVEGIVDEFLSTLDVIADNAYADLPDSVRRRFVEILLAKSTEERIRILEEHIKARQGWLPLAFRWAIASGKASDFEGWLEHDLRKVTVTVPVRDSGTASYIFKLLSEIKEAPASAVLRDVLCAAAHSVCARYYGDEDY